MTLFSKWTEAARIFFMLHSTSNITARATWTKLLRGFFNSVLRSSYLWIFQFSLYRWFLVPFHGGQDRILVWFQSPQICHSIGAITCHLPQRILLRRVCTLLLRTCQPCPGALCGGSSMGSCCGLCSDVSSSFSLQFTLVYAEKFQWDIQSPRMWI